MKDITNFIKVHEVMSYDKINTSELYFSEDLFNLNVHKDIIMADNMAFKCTPMKVYVDYENNHVNVISKKKKSLN